MNSNIKSFSNSNRPIVLLIGNGIARSANNRSWKEIISDLASDQYKDVQLPQTTPYSIKATVMTDEEDNKRFNKYKKEFSNEKYFYENNESLEQLLRLPFDAILTTNYTYEMEYQLKNIYPELSEESKRKYSFNTNKNGSSDGRYLIRTFNRLKDCNKKEKDIWHIHGEQRRMSSMILTHNEYIKLINKIVSYFENRGNEYEENKDDIHYKSWLDYFVLGELYVIGFGFDFSEFDLWWLLNRRIRENVNKSQLSKIHFFEPKRVEREGDAASHSDVCKVLQQMNVSIHDMDVIVDEYLKYGNNAEKNLLSDQYKEFYSKAVNEINKMVMEKKHDNA